MSKIKKISAALLTAAMLFSGCSGEQANGISLDEIKDYTPVNLQTEYYDNYDFNAYYNKEESEKHLPGQGVFGTGNAFILRYNGLYYMYVGSSNNMSQSMPCWVSEDLIYWSKPDNGVTPAGTCADDPRLYYAYPPCVRQFNGKFYMYVYLKNDVVTQGNYILKADSPVGPFEFVTGDDGKPVCYTIEATTTNIDCDIFIDDNEDVYFMSAHQDAYFTGIRAFRMPSMDKINYDENSYINIAESSVGGWTEGNGMFKRNGNYYLMFTGSDILSPGYLTHYAVAENDNWKNAFGTDEKTGAKGFNQGIDWPMGCETDPEFYSLGHATSVLGPDMDALYYHYFSVNTAGPNCTFAIDRLIFNGTAMDSAQTQYHSVKPAMPFVYSYSPTASDEFVAENGKILSKKSHGRNFSAEYNFKGNDVKCVFGYKNEQNYGYVTCDVTAKTVTLHTIENGTDKQVAQGEIVRNYSEDALKTLRIAYRDGKADVYFDDLKKISDAMLSVESGAAGYVYGGDAEFCYTAVSNAAKGISDAVEPKLHYINIGAESYLPAGIIEGHGSSFNGDSGYRLTDESEYGGKYTGTGQIKLENAGDHADFLVDFDQTRNSAESGYYTLYMTLNKNQCGKTFGVRVDGGRIMPVKVPSVNPDNGASLIKTPIAQIPVEKGVREISVIDLGENFAFHSFTFVKSTGKNFSYEQSLNVAPEKGMEQLTLWRFDKQSGDEENSLVSREGVRSLVYFGNAAIENYTVECDFRLNTDSINSAGFIIQGNRYSNSAYITEDYRHIQGYYLSIGKRMVKIEKLNYTHSDGNAAAKRASINIGEWNHVKIEVNGSTLKTTVSSSSGESVTLEFTDDFALSGGRFGFYTSGASASYKNLKISG